MNKKKCPICQEVYEFNKGEIKPFCSDKCKMVDLGRWLGEDYRVPGPQTIVNENEKSEEDENF